MGHSKFKTSFLLLVGTLVVVVGLVWWRTRQLKRVPTSIQQAEIAELTPTSQPVSPCQPTFLDGGGPYYKSNSPFRDTLAPSTHQGEELTVTGLVLASDCQTPLANVIVDLWQANETSDYEDEWYRGRVTTDQKGRYTFTTVIPKGYGEGTAYRPPHIHFKVWRDGQLLVTSQMFLPASRAQGIEEAYIIKLVKTERGGHSFFEGYHDIVLP